MTAEEALLRLTQADSLIYEIDRIASGRNASMDYDMLRIAMMLDEYYGRNE